MPFTSTGIFERLHNWEEDRINGIEIVTDHHDAEDDNFADGLSLTLLKDGRSAMEGDLNLGGNQIINCGAGVNPSDVVTKAQLDAIDLSYVPRRGDCEIFDTKEFISSPLMPKAKQGDDSTKGATTSFVKEAIDTAFNEKQVGVADLAFPTYQTINTIASGAKTPAVGHVIFELPARMVGWISVGNYKKSVAYNYNNTQPTFATFPVAKGVTISFSGCQAFFSPLH